MARVNEDARRVRDALQAELRSLGGSASPLDRYGRYSALEEAMFAEREHVKGLAYDWLAANPTASFAAAAARMEELAVGYASSRPAGQNWVLHRYESVLAQWMANAAAAKLCDANWEAFRDYVLTLGREGALYLR
jgi:hypothetical protein